jgi:ornithine carbamoyltransferase
VGATQEGGNVTFLDNRNSQFGKKESIEDSAKVFGRIYDAIEYRGFEQSVVEDLAKHSGVPVYNGLTDIDHPTQILADIMTIEEHIDKPLSDVKVVFCGDTRNNMAYAWMYGCAKMGMTFVAYGPPELAPEQEVFDRIAPVCAQTGASVIFSSDIADLAGADAVYTDIWASMGEEDQIPDRVKLLTPYKVTERLLEATGNPDVLFMHCLPAFHNFETDIARTQYDLGYDIREVTDEVFRSARSVVFDEAENRMHTIKAIMTATIGKEPTA